jgi:acyl-CoA dehydrogenase
MRPTFAPASNATATTMQVHGVAGVTDDFGLGYAYARARIMRYVDGPEEVHRNTIARMELAKHR